MSGTNHRTWQLYHVGHFIATVLVDPVADDRDALSKKALASVTEQLIDLMDSHRLPTTWAVTDPANSAATSRILRSAVAHEFAILGDASWLGPMAGRTRFARELARRVGHARAAGLSVHTLVSRAASIERDVDLVVKHEISAMASDSARAPLATSSPRALHFGVWGIPISGTMPARASWFSRGCWSTWRRIRGAAKDADTFHLVIDAAAICNEGKAALRAIVWLMKRVATLRDRGLLRVETLRATAERLSDVPVVKPQRSILHRAA